MPGVAVGCRNACPFLGGLMAHSCPTCRVVAADLSHGSQSTRGCSVRRCRLFPALRFTVQAPVVQQLVLHVEEQLLKCPRPLGSSLLLGGHTYVLPVPALPRRREGGKQLCRGSVRRCWALAFDTQFLFVVVVDGSSAKSSSSCLPARSCRSTTSSSASLSTSRKSR